MVEHPARIGNEASGETSSMKALSCIKGNSVLVKKTDFRIDSRFGGRSLLTLIDEGVLTPHATSCTCAACCDDETAVSFIMFYYGLRTFFFGFCFSNLLFIMPTILLRPVLSDYLLLTREGDAGKEKT